MKIKEAIEKSVYQGDYWLVGSVVNILRFRYGLNNDGVFKVFHNVTGMDRPNFEALMLLADCK